MDRDSRMFKSLAKRIVENSYHDKENDILFVTNPGISFDVLKGLAKKHNFCVGSTANGEYVSIPLSYKYNNLNNEDFSIYDDFMSTYTYYDGNYNTMLSAYQTFDLMAENLSEIDLILDTYVAEVLGQGFVENPLNIRISNQKAQTLIEKVFYKNKIYQRLPNITKSLAKYGNYGFTLSYPYLENWMADDEEVDISRLDILEDLVISFINPKNFEVNCDEYLNPINYKTTEKRAYVNTRKSSREQYKIWQNWQFVHMLLPDEITEPYGKSMLWSMRSAFDQLTTLEALLGISRASKIQRLVFYVPMPNGINLVDSYGYLQEFRGQYLNSIFTDMNSNKAGRKVPGAMSILTLPMSHDGKKVEVDHIESNIDLSSVEDVQYFLDKILRNSNLPKGYLVGEDVITTAQTLDAQDLKLRRALIPLKKGLVDGIMNLVEKVLTHAGYDVSKLDVEVSLTEPIQIPADVIAKYNDICELLKSLSDLNNEMTDINKFQFLVKMGMPVDIASLIISKVSINTLDSPEELGKFLTGQKLKSKTALPAPELEETVAYSVTSKQYLKENYADAKGLQIMFNTMTTSLDRSLKEAVLKSEKKYSAEND
ncbi:MAG: portal protein [Succinivibrionaceae bacterium]